MIDESERKQTSHTCSSNDEYSMKQIEMNLIASSFGGLATKTCQLHRWVRITVELDLWLKFHKQVIEGQMEMHMP